MRGGLVIFLLAAGLGSASAAEPVGATFGPEVLQAAGLPDDEVWREVVRSLPGWWDERPNVTAPARPPTVRPDGAWVAVHVFAGQGEAAFAHASASTMAEAAAAALRAARRAAAVVNARPDQVAIFLGQHKLVLDQRTLPLSDWGDAIQRGRAGFLCFDGQTVHDAISPFHVLRRNEVRFRPVLERSEQPPEWHVYTGRQFLLTLTTAPPGLTELLRGKPLVADTHISRAEVEAMTRQASGWLWRNVGDDGRLAYRITLGENDLAPDGDNELRQWMATRALIEAARREKSAAALALARRNIESNLKRFYRTEDDYAVIEMGGQVKLGAAALAALALREFPDAPPEWREREERLERLVSFLWRNDGSFRTFLRPTARAEENQNFYSGEALLYWATRLHAAPEPSLQERFLRSASYYRSWHLAHRNPAFVPWHTMALVTAWPLTRDEPGAAWVFEMNDWLLTIQQPDGAPGHPDTAGRFYSPGSGFGPPHASSTGVYVEGLCAALKLADLTGDAARRQSYARAIRQGLRNARQLQFAGPADWMGLTGNQRIRCEGGFRTTEYDSTIRCDNVQHILQACWAALDLPDDAGIFATR